MVNLSDNANLMEKFLALPLPRMFMYGEQNRSLSCTRQSRQWHSGRRQPPVHDPKDRRSSRRAEGTVPARRFPACYLVLARSRLYSSRGTGVAFRVPSSLSGMR